MIRVSIEPDADDLREILSFFENNTMTGLVAGAVKSAFDRVTAWVQSQWQDWAMGGKIEGVEKFRWPSASAARSFNVNRLGDLHAFIGTDDKSVERMQQGQEAYDMKKTYPYARKGRVSAKGVPYLIIPFRWGAGQKRAHFGGNVASKTVHDLLMERKPSRKTGGTYETQNYKGIKTIRQRIDWGGRIGDGEGTDPDGRDVGMVRFADLPRGTGSYMTFRIISAKSPQESWWRKSVPGVDVQGQMDKALAPQVQSGIEEGVMGFLEGL